MIHFVNNETTAAVLLVSAGVIHNYSFMCRKLPPEHINVAYPDFMTGKILLNLSWVAMALYGFLLCYNISLLLCGAAVAIYFLVLPFLLQPLLARMLGFSSLTEYVNRIDQNHPSDR